jgi:hypothetical protein
MKTRNGFISNSSTSSFVVLGIFSKNWEFEFSDGGYEIDPKLFPLGTFVHYMNREESDVLIGKLIDKRCTYYPMEWNETHLTLDELNAYAKEFEEKTGIKPELISVTDCT